jgi:transglutaminase-like putative cysteine protease
MIEMFVSFLMLMNMTDLEVVDFTNDAVEYYLEYQINDEKPTLKQILETRKGDCTEEAILVKAILKKYGLKVREASGKTIYPKPKIYFMHPSISEYNETHLEAYHTWVEVYIGGEWIEHDREEGVIYKRHSRVIRG